MNKSIYLKKLQAYRGIYNKAGNLIYNYNCQIREKEDLKTKHLNKKIANMELCYSIEKKFKLYPIWRILCAIGIFILIFNFLFPPFIVFFAHQISGKINMFPIVLFGVLTILSNVGISFRKRKLRKKIDSKRREIVIEEERRLSLAKEIAKLKQNISKLEKVKQCAKEEADAIKSILCEYQLYVDSQQEKENISPDITKSKPANKELKNKLY